MANIRKPNGLICLIIVLGALLHNTGAVQVQNKFVGDDVILQPKYIGVPSEMTWRKKDMKVVLLVLIPQEKITFYPLLEDRATINRTNGALTIKNLTIEDTGPFVAEVLVNDIAQYTRIFLDIHVPRTEYKMEGENVTLDPQYTGDPSEIKWMVNGSLLVKMSLKPREEIIFYRFQDRATISPTDGSLTIRKLTIEDSGMYKAEVTVNDIIQETRIQVTVSKYISLSGRIIALIVVLAVNLLIIVLIVLWKCYRNKYDCLSGGIIAPVVIVVLAVISIIIFIIIMWKYYKEESSGLSGGIITLIVVLAFFPIIIILNVWYYYQKSKKSWEAAIKMTNATSTTGLSDEGLPKVSPGTLNEERGGNLTGEEDRSLLAQSQVKKVGDVITLKPQCIGDASKMNWKKDGNKLVDLELNPPWNPIFYRRLQDRATIDRSNGSLTIKDLTVADSGIYKATVLVKGVYQYTKIPLTVRAMSQQIKWMEDDVTLVPKYIGDPSEINWKMNWDTLVEMKLKPRLVHFSHLQDRATISPTDGSLTIKNLTTEDSGLYEAEALVNGVYQKTDIILSVRKSKCITVIFPKAQRKEKVNPRLTIYDVRPEDYGQYVLEVFQSDGGKKQLDIKDKNGDVIIEPKSDGVTLTVTDTAKVMRLVWKKGDITHFQWTVYDLQLHTPNITLEPRTVTLNKGKASYKVMVHSTDDFNSNKNFRWSVLPESRPIVTFHPINVTKDNITWKKDDQLVIIDDDRIKSGPCGELTINNVTPDDKGTYTALCKDQKQEFILCL